MRQQGLKSWLLTHDHKRIAILYLLGVTFFFAIGGLFAVLIRLELATPAGDLVESNTYNKFFTMHGIVMVFLFLIPSIPAVLGNFLIPLMIGAKDVAFPRLNLLSWYIYMIGGLFIVTVLLMGGVDTGWTFYTPFSTSYSNGYVVAAGLGIFIAGFSSILTGLNFIVTIHRMRAPGLTWFRLPLFVWAHYATSMIQVLGTPVVAVTLFLLVLERGLPHRILRSRLRRRPGAVPAHVLVLLASGRLHHDSAVDGRGDRDHHHVQFEEAFRLHVHRVFQRGDRGLRIPRLGPSPVCQQPVGLRRHGVLGSELHCGDPVGDQGLQLDRDHV